MSRLVLICIGGSIGTGARYLLSTWVAQRYGPAFPAGTLFINISGSFLIAAVMELSAVTGAVPMNARLFLTTGVMGGYTTYSSFNYETLTLASSGSLNLAALNVALTVIGALLGGMAGLVAARSVAELGARLAR